MGQYQRQHQFLPDEVLAAEELEDEFNAIQAALNDIDSRVGNVEGGGLIVYNAADPEFAPLGSESNATRVANAIQAALAGDARSKVVWVPRSMWGYSADPDFSLTMFDPAVLVVREGALKPWYDPVAYGADITGTEDAHEIIELCIAHAAQAAGPGSRVVALTVAGDYLLDDDVAHDAGVGFVQLPGVNLTGDGKFTGHPAWSMPSPRFELGGFWYNTDGQDAEARLVTQRKIGRIIPLFVEGETSGLGTIRIDVSDFDPAYTFDDVISVFVVPVTAGPPAELITVESNPFDPPGTWGSNLWFRVFDPDGSTKNETHVSFYAILVMAEV